MNVSHDYTNPAAKDPWWESAPRWDDDPNHPEGVDCHGYPLSSGERCGRSEHRIYSPATSDGEA